MLIELMLKGRDSADVPVSNEVYSFRPDAHGRLVAEVWDEKHIECFLARSDIYRKAEAVTGKAKSRDVSTPEKPAESTPAPASRDSKPESRDTEPASPSPAAPAGEGQPIPADIAAMSRKDLFDALKEAGAPIDAKAKTDALKAQFAALRAAADE